MCQTYRGFAGSVMSRIDVPLNSILPVIGFEQRLLVAEAVVMADVHPVAVGRDPTWSWSRAPCGPADRCSRPASRSARRQRIPVAAGGGACAAARRPQPASPPMRASTHRRTYHRHCASRHCSRDADRRAASFHDHRSAASQRLVRSEAEQQVQLKRPCGLQVARLQERRRCCMCDWRRRARTQCRGRR